MRNIDVTKIFRQVAGLIELQEDSFMPRAYRPAARSIENLNEDWLKSAMWLILNPLRSFVNCSNTIIIGQFSDY